MPSRRRWKHGGCCRVVGWGREEESGAIMLCYSCMLVVTVWKQEQHGSESECFQITNQPAPLLDAYSCNFSVSLCGRRGRDARGAGGLVHVL